MKATRWATAAAVVALLAGCSGHIAPNGRPVTIPIADLVSSPPTQSNPGAPDPLRNCGGPISYRVFVHDAYGSDWSKADDLIAFNKPGSDGLYHLYTIRPDGTDLRRLGQGSSTFPTRTTGSPSWSPSGRYVAFVAEKAVHPGNSKAATPGWGGYSDLWVATADGSRAWQLTDVPDDANHGTLLPEFSPDGRLLEWTERVEAPDVYKPAQAGGFWVIKLGRFSVSPDGTPELTDVQTISPGGSAFNETGGFSSDSTRMLFTSDFETRNFWSNQIYSLDLRTGVITQLTRGPSYNEHPRFTPNGQVIWMSNRDQPYAVGTDWWIMNADGSDPTRLSSFNSVPIWDRLAFRVNPTVVDSPNWSADGSYFFGDVETSLATAESDILKVSLHCS